MANLKEAGLARLWEHIVARLGAKVDKVEGKGLSANDFTNEYKDKLDNMTGGAGIDDAVTSDSSTWSSAKITAYVNEVILGGEW